MDPAGNFQNLEIALTDPATALTGESPRLVDEWQEAPLLWDGVRNTIDRSGKINTFILTGSSIPRKKNSRDKATIVQPKHSGVGRIERLRMRPMSLFESGDSNGTVSLKKLFEGEIPAAQAPSMNLSGLCELAVHGGWPASLGMPANRAQRIARVYVQEVRERDISRVDEVARDAQKATRLLHSLARNAEQSTKSKTVISDMTESATEPKLAAETVTDYIQALERIFIIEEIGPWSPNLRSSARINKRSKYHFVDPSIPVVILKTSTNALMSDFETFGFIFECMCMRDILIYAQAMDAEVYYYRDQTGLEVDVIIESPEGEWAGIEVKLGHNKADAAAKNLKSLQKKIVAAGGKNPVFLAVIEGMGSYAYKREEDGIFIIPICTLTA